MREEYKVECGKEDGKWTITGEKQAEGHGMKRPNGRGNSLILVQKIKQRIRVLARPVIKCDIYLFIRPRQGFPRFRVNCLGRFRGWGWRRCIQPFISFLLENDLRYFDWNVDNGDATGKNYTVEELAQSLP